MTSSRAIVNFVPLLLFAVVASPAAAPAGEISLFGEMLSGDFGTDVDSEMQALALRYLDGDKVRVRIEVPYLRIESTSTVLPSGAGPIPGARLRQAGGNGPGEPTDDPGNPGNGTGPGNGANSTLEIANDEVVSRSEWLSGLGDVRLGVSTRVLGGGARVFRLDAGLDVKVPTADEQDGLGTGEWDTRIGLSGEYRFWAVTTFGGVGWNRLGDPAWIELDNPLDAYAGVEGEPVAGRLLVSGWLETTAEAVAGSGDRTLAGVGITTLGQTRFELQALAGLSDAAPDYAITFGVSSGLRNPLVGPRGVRR